jgi:hypothetical protein
MAQTRPNIVAELANATGVAEADVKKVLEKLGLSKALKNVSALGSDKATAALKLSNAKLAFRIGKSTVAV